MLYVLLWNLCWEYSSLFVQEKGEFFQEVKFILGAEWAMCGHEGSVGGQVEEVGVTVKVGALTAADDAIVQSQKKGYKDKCPWHYINLINFYNIRLPLSGPIFFGPWKNIYLE